ncbi:Enhancer of polycomb-like protein 1 [Gonapodya sp. JEL0774]|nr:Enhancer of polycomb-like protein 1 [Gonapodya sp. JEL0774]
MDERDDEWLANYNGKVVAGEYQGAPTLTEDQFEELMWGLEKLVGDKQSSEQAAASRAAPIASYPTLREFGVYVENATKTLPSSRQVVKLETLKESATYILEWWKKRRTERGGLPIQPVLKMEDNGTNDPYVCFRRREIRPLRKTRRVDAHSMDRIRLLRDQMRRALDLADMVAKREKLRREALLLDELVFRQRVMVRQIRRKMGLPVIGEAEQALDRPRKKQKVKAPVDATMDPNSGPLVLPPDRTVIAQLIESPERLAEQRLVKQREEDERAGISDQTIEDAVVVDTLYKAADLVGWQRDVVVPGLIGLVQERSPVRFVGSQQTGGDGQVVPKTPDADDMDTDLPSMAPSPTVAADKGKAVVVAARPRVTTMPEELPLLGRIPLARTRIGRGGRLIVDRRARLRDVICGSSNAFGNGGKTRPGWKPGDFSERVLNFSEEDRERGLDEIWRKRKWEEDEDEEEQVLGEEDDGMEWETTSDLSVFRASIMRDATGDHNEFITKSRYPLQAYPSLTPLHRQLAQQQYQQQQQAQGRAQGGNVAQQQFASKNQRRTDVETPAPIATSGLNGSAAASAPSTPKGSLTPKQTTRPPIKPEPQLDPKTATVKMLMKESAKGAQQIHQIQAELQRTQQQWRMQAQAGAQQNHASVQQNHLPVQQVGSGTNVGAVTNGLQNGYTQLPSSMPAGSISVTNGALVANGMSLNNTAFANGIMTMPTSTGASIPASRPSFTVQNGPVGTFQAVTSAPQGNQTQTASVALQNSAAAAAMLAQAQGVGVNPTALRQLMMQQAVASNPLFQQRVRPNNGIIQSLNVTGVPGTPAMNAAVQAQNNATYQYLLASASPLLRNASATQTLKGLQLAAQNGGMGQLLNSPNRGNLNGVGLNGIAGLSSQQIQQLAIQGANTQNVIFQLQQRQQQQAMFQQLQASQNVVAAAGDGQIMEPMDEKGQ